MARTMLVVFRESWRKNTNAIVKIGPIILLRDGRINWRLEKNTLERSSLNAVKTIIGNKIFRRKTVWVIFSWENPGVKNEQMGEAKIIQKRHRIEVANTIKLIKLLTISHVSLDSAARNSAKTGMKEKFNALDNIPEMNSGRVVAARKTSISLPVPNLLAITTFVRKLKRIPKPLIRVTKNEDFAVSLNFKAFTFNKF